MKDKNRSLIKEYAMKWNLHDIKRACQVNGFPAFFGIVMLFGLLSGGVSRADEEIFVSDFLTGSPAANRSCGAFHLSASGETGKDVLSMPNGSRYKTAVDLAGILVCRADSSDRFPDRTYYSGGSQRL